MVWYVRQRMCGLPAGEADCYVPLELGLCGRERGLLLWCVRCL